METEIHIGTEIKRELKLLIISPKEMNVNEIPNA